MAKNNQRDPNLRAATVARVNQLLKGGLTKAGAFEKISSETGRAKDAVQMLYYRAVRAGAAAKPAAKTVAPKAPAPVAAAKPVAVAKPVATAKPVVAAKAATAAKPVVASKPVVSAAPAAAATPAATPAAKPSRRRSRRSRKPARAAAPAAPRAQSVAQSGDFPSLLNGIAVAINNLLKHVEKTVEDNTKLRAQAERLQAITSLIRGR